MQQQVIKQHYTYIQACNIHFVFIENDVSEVCLMSTVSKLSVGYNQNDSFSYDKFLEQHLFFSVLKSQSGEWPALQFVFYQITNGSISQTDLHITLSRGKWVKLNCVGLSALSYLTFLMLLKSYAHYIFFFKVKVHSILKVRMLKDTQL